MDELRKQKNITNEQIAEYMGYHSRTISVKIKDAAEGHADARFMLKLCAILDLGATEGRSFFRAAGWDVDLCGNDIEKYVAARELMESYHTKTLSEKNDFLLKYDAGLARLSLGKN